MHTYFKLQLSFRYISDRDIFPPECWLPIFLSGSILCYIETLVLQSPIYNLLARMLVLSVISSEINFLSMSLSVFYYIRVSGLTLKFLLHLELSFMQGEK